MTTLLSMRLKQSRNWIFLISITFVLKRNRTEWRAGFKNWYINHRRKCQKFDYYSIFHILCSMRSLLNTRAWNRCLASALPHKHLQENAWMSKAILTELFKNEFVPFVHSCLYDDMSEQILKLVTGGIKRCILILNGRCCVLVN